MYISCFAYTICRKINCLNCLIDRKQFDLARGGPNRACSLSKCRKNSQCTYVVYSMCCAGMGAALTFTPMIKEILEKSCFDKNVIINVQNDKVPLILLIIEMSEARILEVRV